jgi:lipoprotein-anchoring transpeptidase ErfK/SrfK
MFGRLAQRTARTLIGLMGGAAAGLLAWGALALIRGESGAPSPASVAVSPSLGEPALQTRPAWLTDVVASVPTLAVPPLQPEPAWSNAVVVPLGNSLVAEARRRRVAVYRSAGSARPHMSLANPNPDGSPLVFLVASARGHWLRVLLPTRPNLSRGWIARRDVRLALDPYRIAVELRRHKMKIWRDGRLVQHYRVGVGKRAVTPTPFGLYYITELLRQPNPGGVYGPYAFGLSAHSNVLHEFAGGNGEIGIHGTNEPWAVGTNVSHGCIRVYNRVITRLAHELPLGTPVRIEP